MYRQSAVTNTSAEYDLGLRQFMLGVYNNMSIGLAISAIIAYFVGTNPALLSFFFGGPQQWIVIFAPLAFIFFISFRITKMSVGAARTSFYAFAAVMGLSLSTIFAVFQMGSIVNAFLATAVMFGSMSLYGYTTKRDLTSVGSFLIMGAFGLVIASLLNLFFQNDIMSLVISALAVIIFTGLTAYDTQNLKNMYYQLDGDERAKMGIMGALSLYLNFINIFTSLLNLFGARTNE
jgi:uncharacterized protein